ncbi:MAG: LptF/LptG family permease [Pseudomonadota bacterium]
MTLVRFLSAVILRHVLLATLVLTSLALGIDLLDAADDVAGAGGGIGRYTLLRLPGVLLAVAPAGLLAGAAVGFASMAVRHESTVLRAQGLGAGQLLMRLLPLAALLGLGLQALAERVEPAATRAMAAEFPTLGPAARSDRATWLRTPDAVLRVREVGAEELRGVTIYALDADGDLAARLDAARARWSDGWTLSGVDRRDAEVGRVEAVASLPWPGLPAPDDIARLTLPAALVTARIAREILRAPARGLRGPGFYRVRAARRWSILAVPPVMLLLTAPAALAGGRDGRTLRATALGIALGFAFLLADGLARTLGEGGAIDPALAVWGPTALFAVIGAWSLLIAET